MSAAPVVLGLNLGHDRSACLAVGGRPLVAIAEERLSRRKHDIPRNPRGELYNEFPHLAVDYLLQATGVGFGEIDAVFAGTTYVLDAGGSRRNLEPEDIRRHCPELGAARIEVVGHHLAHAASAAFCCGRDAAAVLVVDGGGSIVGFTDGEPREFERSSIFGFREGSFELLGAAHGGPPSYGNSIGDFYQVISRFLGFRSGDEGKLMGMAGLHAGGRPRPLPQFEEAIAVGADGDHRVAAPFQYMAAVDFHPTLVEWFGEPRERPRPEDPLDLRIAASAQWALEEAMVALAQAARELSGAETLCLAGGVALNCLANERIARLHPGPLFIQPAASDDGTALGNALLGSAALGADAGRPLRTPHLGRSYSPAELELAARAAADLAEVDDCGSPAALAADIAAGKIVALMRGGSEFGPRALGHRSILCDPRQEAMKEHLNARVKHREAFRPFAPMVLEERAEEFFELDRPSPHMLLAARVRRPEALPAVTHVDGTARVQTVRREDDPFLWETIDAFARETGVPVLLNTSFNDQEPIVETPADAVACFLKTGIDVLHLESVRLSKLPVRT
jgi:carbamoyltransferase